MQFPLNLFCFHILKGHFERHIFFNYNFVVSEQIALVYSSAIPTIPTLDLIFSSPYLLSPHHFHLLVLFPLNTRRIYSSHQYLCFNSVNYCLSTFIWILFVLLDLGILQISFLFWSSFSICFYLNPFILFLFLLSFSFLGSLITFFPSFYLLPNMISATQTNGCCQAGLVVCPGPCRPSSWAGLWRVATPTPNAKAHSLILAALSRASQRSSLEREHKPLMQVTS